MFDQVVFDLFLFVFGFQLHVGFGSDDIDGAGMLLHLAEGVLGEDLHVVGHTSLGVQGDSFGAFFSYADLTDHY